jgi:D-glycero-alpha-D-manno-heptose-7-phosphate kinase
MPMLIARAPVRISFVGGGTDLEAYYAKHGGKVISTTIDKYFYTFLQVYDADTVQITSADYHTFYRHDPDREWVWNGNLRLPQAILEHFGVRRGLGMFLASEIPPGTGLGSSSTVAVAIIKALSTAIGQELSRRELAELACYVEIEKLGMPIGKQDQYAAAHGGLNRIEFSSEQVEVRPLTVTAETRDRLQRNLLLFFTGSARDSKDILKHQRSSTERDEGRVTEALHAVKGLVDDAQDALERGHLGRFGELLHSNWENKKRFAPGVTNPRIDECYALALHSGAIGGKITGAGGGGFLMLYCEEPYHDRLTRAMEAKGLQRMDYRFDVGGARVLMNAGLRIPDESR